MAMTKKDYVMVAEIIASMPDDETRNDLLIKFGNAFEERNERFDFWLFKGHMHAARNKMSMEANDG